MDFSLIPSPAQLVSRARLVRRTHTRCRVPSRFCAPHTPTMSCRNDAEFIYSVTIVCVHCMFGWSVFFLPFVQFVRLPRFAAMARIFSASFAQCICASKNTRRASLPTHPQLKQKQCTQRKQCNCREKLLEFVFSRRFLTCSIFLLALAIRVNEHSTVGIVC